MESLDDLGTAVFAFQQAVEKVGINIAWRENNEEKIFQWLKSRAGKVWLQTQIIIYNILPLNCDSSKVMEICCKDVHTQEK